MEKDKKVVIITGASSGIGKCLAEMFCKDDIVYGLSRRIIEAKYKQYHANVLDYDRLANIAKEINDKHGHIDMLICCAGMGVAGAVELMGIDDITYQLDVNLRGVINANKAVIPYMRNQGYGKIINISSLAAIAPMPFQSMYSASKAGINVYSLALANELKPFNIKVCTIMPDDISSGFTLARKKSLIKTIFTTVACKEVLIKWKQTRLKQHLLKKQQKKFTNT